METFSDGSQSNTWLLSVQVQNMAYVSEEWDFFLCIIQLIYLSIATCGWGSA
jgi:hypothetical protein